MRITTLGLISAIAMIIGAYLIQKDRYDKSMAAINGRKNMLTIIQTRQGCANLTAPENLRNDR